MYEYNVQMYLIFTDLQLTVENNENVSDMIDNGGLSIHMMKDDDGINWSFFEKSGKNYKLN